MRDPGSRGTSRDGIELERIFREHREGLAGVVRALAGPGIDTHEVLQEAFLRSWRAWGHRTKPGDPRAWVFVVTMNTARDLRRRGNRRLRRIPEEDADPMELQSKDRSPAQRLEGTETLARIRAAIGELKDPEKEVFLLRVAGGSSFTAIAEALHIPEGTAKTRMRSALARLRRVLGPLVEEKPSGV